MEKIIRNKWCSVTGEPFLKANILSHKLHPEGFDVDRIRFYDSGSLKLNTSAGYIISIINGQAGLQLAGKDKAFLHLEKGVHVYLPSGQGVDLVADKGTEFIQVSSYSDSQARGKQLILRDETFLSACAISMQPLRWIFTSQYLSRRIFLHHDQTFLSKSGNPVSWFHTTMFDVAGLPVNEDGEPVFKMSYNSRTEFNVCYQVAGSARVRMAQHPYSNTQQLWGAWHQLDGETTYHANEVKGGSDEECHFDDETQTPYFLRNKHEVYIENGYVDLFNMFDPAPTGVETHRPGEYSDYEPLEKVVCTDLYANHQRTISKFDAMVDTLSLAKAKGNLSKLYGTPAWQLYQQGRQEQIQIESAIASRLASEGKGREQVIERWRLPVVSNFSEKSRIAIYRRADALTPFSGLSAKSDPTHIGQPNVGR